MATLAEVWAAYEQARGRWSGCDWPTHFGRLGLDLEGVSSLEARAVVRRWRAIAVGEVTCEVSAQEHATLSRMALCLGSRSGVVWRVEEGLGSPRLAPTRPTRRHCAQALAQEWDFAACVLAEIESDASLAEREAWAAMRAAERGHWETALEHAGRASALEAGYHGPRLWARVAALIEAVAGQTGHRRRLFTGIPFPD